MTDYRKRLEAGLALADRYEMGGVELGEQGVQINFEDLRQLLSEGEGMREALVEARQAMKYAFNHITGEKLDGRTVATLALAIQTAERTLGDPNQ